MIDDPDFDGSNHRITDHYRACQHVYAALGTVDGHVTNYVTGNAGWYEINWDNDWVHRRARTASEDFGSLLSDLGTPDPDGDITRTLYAVTSWKDADVLYGGARAVEYDAFGDGDGLANYDDIRATTAWVDGDLKEKGRRGNYTNDERAEIESEIGRIIEIVANMYGLEPEKIAAFDSGGGIYPWGPAGATMPVTEAFLGGPDDLLAVEKSSHETALGLVYDELTDRIADHLDEMMDAEGFEYIDADAGTNKNRQSKAPLAIHSSHDVVVAPVRGADGVVDYTPTLVSDTDTDLIRRSLAEVNKIVTVSDETRGAVETLIETLYPEYPGDWKHRLDLWLTDKQNDAIDEDHSRALDAKRVRERTSGDGSDIDGDGLSISCEADGDDVFITTARSDVFRDIDRIDVEEVCGRTIVEKWTDQTSQNDTASAGKRSFHPTWRDSVGGTSCYVYPDGGYWHDTGENYYGTVVEAALIDSSHSYRASTSTANGQLWRAGVQELRDMGYSIAYWTPEAGSMGANGTYSQTPEWAIVKVAHLNGCDPADDIYREVKYGTLAGTTEEQARLYTEETGIDTQRSVNSAVFNAALNWLSEQGIDHQRSERSPESDDRDGVAEEIRLRLRREQ